MQLYSKPCSLDAGTAGELLSSRSPWCHRKSQRFLLGTDSTPEIMRQSTLACVNAALWQAPDGTRQCSGVGVGFVVYGHQLPDARLRIALRGGKRCVAQKFLNGAQIRSVVQQVCGKSMAQ
jgi:hypothetical protein